MSKEMTCMNCGRTFQGKNASKHCSPECRTEWRERPRKLTCQECGEDYVGPRKSKKCKPCLTPPTVYKTCGQCGKEFLQTKETKTNIFCSIQCSASSRSKQVTIECAHCGVLLTRKRTQVERAERSFCSRDCLAHATRYSGNEHYYVKSKSKRMHRAVMEDHLGRPLEPSEHVHHINGDKWDNRIENLMLITASEHARLHMETRNKVKGNLA